MGKFSRDKGKRNEYLLRDSLRLEGYTADRVPSSGAAQGFKGDIKFSKYGKTYLAELKARATEFDSIYAMWDKRLSDPLWPNCLKFTPEAGMQVTVHFSMRGALEDCDGPEQEASDKRAEKKLKNMKKLLGECDVLVLKGDRKPFLYVRYLCS